MDNFQLSSDADLLTRSLAGDECAFVALYGRLKAGIFRYAFYMTSSKTAAEEVTQEVFITLLKDGCGYRENRGDVGAFVFGIARNFVRRIERRERPYLPLPIRDSSLESLASTLVAQSDDLSGRMIRDEVREKVQAAIASLPDHYRQPVVLCDLCELSYEDAAARLDCAVGAIRSRVNRAHAILAQKLEPLRRSSDVRSTGTERCLI